MATPSPVSMFLQPGPGHVRSLGGWTISQRRRGGRDEGADTGSGRLLHCRENTSPQSMRRTELRVSLSPAAGLIFPLVSGVARSWWLPPPQSSSWPHYVPHVRSESAHSYCARACHVIMITGNYRGKRRTVVFW